MQLFQSWGGWVHLPRVAPMAQPLYVIFLSSLFGCKPNGKMGPRSGLQAGARRRGCDRSTLGPFESEAQPDPSVLLRPELEPLPERRLKHASSNPQE